MVRKIETEQRKHLDPSTVRDLLSIKLNNSTPCFDNEHLRSKDMLKKAKSAHQEQSFKERNSNNWYQYLRRLEYALIFNYYFTVILAITA